MPLPSVAKPKHKLSELTTYELRDHREQLERAISFAGEEPGARAALQTRLDAVLAEQDERERIARA